MLHYTVTVQWDVLSLLILPPCGAGQVFVSQTLDLLLSGFTRLQCCFPLHWIPLSLFQCSASAPFSSVLEHFQMLFFFFVLLVPSISFSLTALWKCRETYKHISVNTSDVVPEFKSFTHNTGRHDLGLFVWRKKAELAKNLTALYVCVCVWTKTTVCVHTLLLASYSFVFSFFSPWSLCGADVHLQGCAERAFLSIFTGGCTC